MFIWYRNSILASLVSLMGCAGVVAGISELMKDPSLREMSVPEIIGFMAAGVLFAILGKVISSNKEKKKQAAAANACYTQPVPTRSVQQTPVSTPAPEKPVGRSIGLAKACWLLATVCSLFGFYLYRTWMRGAGRMAGFDRLAVLLFLTGMVCLLLVFASSASKKKRSASALYVPGFLGLMAIHAEDAVRCYRAYGFGGYIANDGSTYYALISVPLLRIAAFLLMLVFALIAMKNTRERNGGVVRVLWFVPFVMLAFAFAKATTDSYLFDLISSTLFAKGVRLTMRPEYMDMLTQIFIMLGVLVTGFFFRSCCQDVQAVSQPMVDTAPMNHQPVSQQPAYVRSEPQAAYAPPVQEEPRYAAYTPEPAARPAAARPSQQEVEKKLQAYKDLLDCGILTQEEYDQQVYELTHQ